MALIVICLFVLHDTHANFPLASLFFSSNLSIYEISHLKISVVVRCPLLLLCIWHLVCVPNVGDYVQGLFEKCILFS